MSQLSLNRRLDRLLDAVLPPGSRERALHDLPDGLRAQLAEHEARCERATRHYEMVHGEGSAFVDSLDGVVTAPPMPDHLARALGIPPAPVITTDMSAGQASEVYRTFAEGIG